MRRIWVVFRKEVLDNLRDRRSISSSLLTPVFMPIFLIALIMVVGRTLIREAAEAPLNLPVAGAEHAPELVAFLQMNNVAIAPAPDDPRAAVREGDASLVMIVSPEYGAQLRRGRPAAIDVVIDTSRQSAGADVQRLRQLLMAYEGTIGSLRLQARGVSPQVMDVLAINSIDVATPQSQSIIFLNMMPFLLIMTIFLGAMYVVIDATAGERERGSLEPLLINPIYRSELVLGKYLASLPFALFSLGLTLLLFGIGFNLIPLEEYVGFKMEIGQEALWNIFWLCVPIVLLASAMQMVVATFTRSFKEAQTYLSFLPLIVGLPGAFLGFLPVRTSLNAMLVPTYGQSLLINQFLRGETVVPEYITASTLATLALTLLLLLVSIRLYGREQILLGR